MGAVSFASQSPSVFDHFAKVDFASDYKREVRLVFGTYASQLNQIFPNRFALIPMATRQTRRNVWKAYLSHPTVDLSSLDDEAKSALRQRFIYASATDLLSVVYDTLPTGFLGLVKRCGDQLKPQGFLHLHEVLSRADFAPFQLYGVKLTDGLLAVLRELPDGYRIPKIAQQFGGPQQYEGFMAVLDQLDGMGITKTKERAFNAILQGATPVKALEQLVDNIRFGSPVLKGEGLTYLDTPKAMKRAAITFKNCLKDRIDRALIGDEQVYLWEADRPVVFSIAKVTANTWAIEDIEQEDELITSVSEFPDLCELLTDHAVQLERVTLSRAVKRFEQSQRHRHFDMD